MPGNEQDPQSVIQPTDTEAGAIAPAAIDPGAIDPGAIDPCAIDPGAIDPAGTDPAGTDPAGTDPAGTDPAGTDPAGTDPGAIDPAAIDPGAPAGEEGQAVPHSRFNQVYYQKKQLEKEVEQLKAQQQDKAVERQVMQAQEGKPKLEDFDYDDEKFQDALVDFKLDQRDKVRQQQQVNQQQEKSLTAFKDKQAPYMQANPGYQQLTQAADAAGVIFEEKLAGVILKSEAGLQIHHHLLANPEKLERFNNGNFADTMREIIQLESNFKPGKRKTSAPAPIQPGNGGGGIAPVPNGATLSPDAYYKQRMAEKKAR